MEVTTKYNIGDEVYWFVRGNKRQGKITKITINVDKDSSVYIYYYVANDYLGETYYRQDRLFPAKEL